ncbi:hypothetical protein K402DRAFT_202146 [Aulographum hederae CBS 113979]|uniref:Uncharacterized protein n=1 Tax=Aulographum hederae CBS 113979 TaxID=1176131 RepID=A0A6G1HBU9_9PEZI|nr:hypothetical protein K402DRAFT_202146 [Aulographum hederae CBS 113979]
MCVSRLGRCSQPGEVRRGVESRVWRRIGGTSSAVFPSGFTSIFTTSSGGQVLFQLLLPFLKLFNVLGNVTDYLGKPFSEAHFSYYLSTFSFFSRNLVSVLLERIWRPQLACER